MVDPHLQIVPEDIRHLPMVHIDRCESAVGQCGPRFYEGLEVKSPVLATSKSGTHWEPRDQGLDGGLVSSLRALL